MIVAIETDNTPIVHKFFKNIQANKDQAMIRTECLRTGNKEHCIFVLNQNILIPEIWKFGFFVLIPAILLKSIPIGCFAVMFFASGFVYTPRFHYLAFSAGLKKLGYKGKTRLLSNEEVIKGLMPFESR